MKAQAVTTAIEAVPVTPVVHHSHWTFTQGLILGQLSFLVLCLVFIRYVVFSPADAINDEEWKKRRDERAKKALLSTTAVPPPPPSTLLGKTGYEMATHPAESTDWMNVLLAQILQGYRDEMLSHGGEEGARVRIESWLNPDRGNLSWLDPIRVTALSLGTAYPLLSNARIRPADGQGRVIDMDYADTLSLSLATSVLINFPRPRFAVLPVSLGVELASIGGTIHEPVDGKQQLHVCLLPDFHLNLKTTTLLGSRAKLQDVPKLEQLILTRLRGIIQDRLVHPNHLTLSLPGLQSTASSSSTAESASPLSPESKPIVADLGERTVNGIKEGISQAAADLMHISPDQLAQIGENLLPTLSSPPASPPAPIPNSDYASLAQAQSRSQGLPMGLGQKKIVMPATFPINSRSNSTFDSRAATPMQTPGYINLNEPQHAVMGMTNGSGGAGPGPSSSRPPNLSKSSSYRHNPNSTSQYTGNSANGGPMTPGGGSSAMQSSYRPPVGEQSLRDRVLASQAQTQGQARSLGDGQSQNRGQSQSQSQNQNQSQSQFRFRGQFASQPGTPGVGGGYVGTSTNMNVNGYGHGDDRRGVLNARGSQ